MEFILCGDIVYNPDIHCISKCNDTESRVMLALPASQCFLLLLKNRGEVVSHADFYSTVWEARGASVSPNTLYQNISILRKSLSAFGLPDDFIKTIPKRGFTIKDTPDIYIISGQETAVQTEIENTLPERQGIINAWGDVFQYVIFAFIPIFIFFISYFLSSFFYGESSLKYKPAEYRRLSNAGQCQIFRNITLKDDLFYFNFIKMNHIDCSHPEWLYITNYPPSQKISLIRCNKKLILNNGMDNTLCISDYYLGNIGINNEKN